MLKLFILSFLVSVIAGYLILRWEHLHARFTGDVALPGSHKVHTMPVVRIGGVSIFIGWMVGLCASAYSGKLPSSVIVIWTICLLPVFLAGLTEDLTKRITPAIRLQFSLVTAALAYMLLDAGVNRIDVAGIDVLLALPAVSFLFTLLAIGGVAHAINIIDGLNGLASSVCLIALVALGYVAFSVNDFEILLMCGLGAGALLGFHVWNYPNGRIFCGDGGAYFLGAYIAILATLLVSRNQQVSAWVPFLLVLYPVWETVFSAYRRKMRGMAATSPDQLHLHTLVYQRRKHGGALGSANGKRTRRNSDASLAVIMLAGGNAIPAVLWWSEGAYLVVAALIYIIAYLVIYSRLVRAGTDTRKYLSRPTSAGGDVDFPSAARSLHKASLAERDGDLKEQLFVHVEEHDV